MDTKTIVTGIFDRLHKEFVVSIIRYGRKNGRDIDALVIVRDKPERLGYARLPEPPYDLVVIGQSSLATMIANLDPMLTEPILTGDELYGDSFQNITEQLRQTKPHAKIGRYLLYSATIFLGWAYENLAEERAQAALASASYAASYLRFARHYATGGKLITFTELLDGNTNDLASKIRRAAKSAERSKATDTTRLLALVSQDLVAGFVQFRPEKKIKLGRR